jgi:MSHA biogenesis protein MshG
MPVYRYTGRSVRGRLVSGNVDGESPDGVAARLLEGGITPIEIAVAALEEQTNEAGADIKRFAQRFGLGHPTVGDLVLFSRQMYTITKSGIPLLRGLRGLVGSTHNEILRAALQDILDSLESGRDLGSSFRRHPDVFPPLYVNLIAVGEATGTLEKAFGSLAEYLAQDKEMQDRVKAAMRYPIIVMVVIAIAIGVITSFVIPRFAPLFRALGNDIPWPTRVIMNVSSFAQHDAGWAIGGAVAVALLIRTYVRTEAGRLKWHGLKLRLPVFGRLSHEASLARASRTLATSLRAGLPMLQVLSLIGRSAGNDHMTQRILKMREAVERGEPLSRAAASAGMFPPLVLQMMVVGEETGELGELLDEVAGFYEREVDYSLKNLSAAIEPILIVCVGGMVLVLALGVFLPMWELIAKVGNGQGG